MRVKASAITSLQVDTSRTSAGSMDPVFDG